MHHIETAHLPVPTVRVLDHTKLIRVTGTVPAVNIAGDTQHNHRTPIFSWFQDTPLGKEIFLALYTKPCRWKRCSFCTLPSQSSPVALAPVEINDQVTQAFDALDEAQLSQVQRVFLSNNGSILDGDTMPRVCLEFAIRQAIANCPDLKVICLETRFETVTAEVIGWVYDCIRTSMPLKKISLQFSGGYETQDPYLRNAILFKGYAENHVQDFFALCEQVMYADTHAFHVPRYPIMLDEYVMLKPAAGMTDSEAIAEATETIVHLDKLGEFYGLPVSIRLNPAFAAIGSELYKQFEASNYTPPTLRDTYRVIECCRQRGSNLPIFVGLNNEGLTTSTASCFGNWDTTDEAYRKAVQRHNSDQDFEALREAIIAIERGNNVP